MVCPLQPSRSTSVETALDRDPLDLLHALRERSAFSLLLDGRGGFEDAWGPGPLLALQPRCPWWIDRGGREEVTRGWVRLSERVEQRRGTGTAETGVAALVGYEALESPSSALRHEALPAMVVLEVDRSVRWVERGRVRLTFRAAHDGPVATGRELDAMIAELAREPPGEEVPPPAARIVGRPASSLPREAYLLAVEAVKRHISRGDIYQANLCQRFAAAYAGDPLGTYRALQGRAPAPRSAWLGTPWFALASISPETFLRVVDPGWIETWPIKGTRPRGASPEEDRAAVADLLASEKDRAELLMIVDLERNDLSRICRAGTVDVPELACLRSYAAVHHLVARVRGRLREGTDAASILQATFPGGSITGAPKVRAMQILRALEPVPRNFFTGSLLWFGDDGTLDSSILIRSLVFGRERVFLGAGGGIVADSEPEEEWRESNHKARAPAEALGFAPEDAT